MITPYLIEEIPKYRNPHLNDYMQGFVDKLTTITIPEINAQSAASATVLSPIFLEADTTFTTSQQPEELRQTYFLSGGLAKEITFTDADTIHNYSDFEDDLYLLAAATFNPEAILDIWWRDISGDKHVYFLITFSGGGAAGVCELLPPVPDYGIVDCVTPDYTMIDY